ncbi:hypothetical protein [Rufibacter sp. LB8]|uniref:hypothetical protein n=1 Tax=Rufibacter sp. LB8 TaxID=2777781 RepID=UPI00178C3FE3|nr:hypothetical protein [Rufibacter sp. LB8]
MVEKNRVLELPEANRNFEKFRIEPPKLQDRNVTYRFTEYRLPEHYINLPMRVLTIRQEDLTKLYGNYVKGGIGNYGTIYGRGYFHNKRDDKASYGAEVGHLSSANGPVKNSGAANSFVQAHGELYQGNLTFGGKARYERDQNYFYGYDQSREVNTDTLKQVYNRFLAEGHFNNLIDIKSPLKYSGLAGVTYTGDNFTAKETNVYASFKTTYALSKESGVLVDVDAAYANLKGSEKTFGRSFFKIRPAYTRQVDKLSLVLGGTLAYTSDTINDSRKLNLYPALEASYQAIENKLTLFAGATGDLQRTTLYSLSKENPFLNHDQYIADVNKGLEFFGGLNGSLGKYVQFTARVAHQQYRNLYFYNNALRDSSQFDLVYDDGVTKVLQVFGQLTYNQSEDLRIGIKAENNSYSTASLEKAYHRPELILTTFGTYNLYDKILFNAELYYISSSYGRITRGADSPPALVGAGSELKETDTVVDLNLKADYRFSQRLSAFIMGNNLLNNKYQRLVNYPTQGLSVIGGVTYSF